MGENNGKEEDKVTYKDVYESLWRRRDFELSHLWQRSIFLTAFLVMCFTAYGAVVMKLLECGCHFISINLLAFVISIMGIIFSCLWIMMGKGSKAWYEVHENAISAFSENKTYFKDEGVSEIAAFSYDKIKSDKSDKLDKLTKCILSGKGGAYSPSRINIAIGQVSLVIWIVILIFHAILITFGNNFILSGWFSCLVIFGGIIIIWIFFRLVFCKKILYLHSKTLEEMSNDENNVTSDVANKGRFVKLKKIIDVVKNIIRC